MERIKSLDSELEYLCLSSTKVVDQSNILHYSFIVHMLSYGFACNFISVYR